VLGAACALWRPPMSVPHLTIAGVTAKAVVAPLARPVRTAVGTIPAAPLVLIAVTTREGITGQAYIFAYTTTALPALHRLVGDIGAELIGMPAAPQEVMRHFDRRFSATRVAGPLGHGRVGYRHGPMGCIGAGRRAACRAAAGWDRSSARRLRQLWCRRSGR
jgi:hypothetical protein